MIPMTFDELCRTFRVTPSERERLAWHLGSFRMRKTYERLRKPRAALRGQGGGMSETERVAKWMLARSYATGHGSP